MPNKHIQNAGHSLIGILFGTGVLFYAQNLTPSTDFSKYLALSSPTITAIGDGLSVFVTGFCYKLYSSHCNNKARNTIVKNLKNPHTSEQHKQNLKNKLEHLETQDIDNMLNPDFNIISSKSNNSRKPKQVINK
jgi:hypothetical protein